ncbi:hypothetical protein TSOC_002403 [Tetrabaena socialis]|uniref:phytol kinase n=1 Tax=Tetrabaena socialis TaxID=47790 RepID=A0A2J8AEB7_9CHLO|nr:hypothetical protein TSOC_002403 [Tetrabaena socialis]|eukprot:PNH10863.1 hypothetical protein TSOC_002403 [Tetrabaena socialis]
MARFVEQWDQQGEPAAHSVQALLSSPSHALALLRLMARSVREAATPEPGLELASHVTLFFVRAAPLRPAATDFLRSLVRMQTVQSCAQQLATAATLLLANQPQQTAARSPRSGAQDVLPFLAKVLTQALLPIAILVNLVDVPAGHHREPDGSKQQQQQQQQRDAGRALAREVVRALRDSCFLEHAARLMVLPEVVIPQVEKMVVWANSTRYNFFQSFAGALTLYDNLTEIEGEDATAAALREALSGPCARHAALVHGLAALCAADGGPSYGLPAAALAAAAPELAPAGRLPFAALPLGRSVMLCSVAALERCSGGPGQPGRRAAVGVLLRIVRLAVASAEAWYAEADAKDEVDAAAAAEEEEEEEEEQEEEKGEEERRAAAPRPAPPMPGGSGVGGSCATGASSVPPQPILPADAELAGFIDLLQSAVGRLLLPLIGSDGAEGLSLPPAPPPHLALEGGLLPCVERTLRRACCDPDGPEGCVLGGLLGGWDLIGDRGRHLFTPLLAYGGPRQAAALVLSPGKLLRCPLLPGLLWSRPWTDHRDQEHVLLRAAGAFLTDALLPASGERGGGGGGGGGGGPPPRLAGAASLVACVWLPALSALVLRSIADDRLLRCGPAKLRFLLRPLLLWLPVLASRCCDGAGGGADPASRAPTAAPRGAVCRTWLLEEVRAVPLLGAALRLMQQQQQQPQDGGEAGGGGKGGEADVWTDRDRAELSRSCVALAAACPAQVREAALWRRRVVVATAPLPSMRRPAEVGAAAVAVGAEAEAVAEASSDGVGAPAPLPLTAAPSCAFPWRANLLRGLWAGGSQRRREKGAAAAAAAEDLGVQLEGWVAEARAGEVGLGAHPEPARREQQAAAEVLALPARGAGAGLDLAHPRAMLAAARALLRTCSRAACPFLDGGSEAKAAPLNACARCGCAWYCCRQCQVEDWRAGHQAACAGATGHGGGTFKIAGLQPGHARHVNPEQDVFDAIVWVVRPDFDAAPRSCVALAAACPAQVREAALWRRRVVVATAPLPSMRRPAEVGAAAVAVGAEAEAVAEASSDGVGAPAPLPLTAAPSCAFPWRANLLRGLWAGGSQRRREKGAAAAAAAEDLAVQLEGWVAEARAGEVGLGAHPEPARREQQAAAEVLALPARGAGAGLDLAHPRAMLAAARALLRTCSRAACPFLDGGSEAKAAPLNACARCGCAWYCCRQCQVEDWRAGHQAACAGATGHGGGTFKIAGLQPGHARHVNPEQDVFDAIVWVVRPDFDAAP